MDAETSEVRFIYVTTSGQEEAYNIARKVVDERLAACANLMGSIKSLYHWKGELQEDDEVAMILKTRAAKVEDLTRRVLELHSYDCPCVVALPAVGGNPEFLGWIASETA